MYVRGKCIAFCRMEDKGSGKDVITVWKLDDPAVLRKEREQRDAVKEEKARQKLEHELKLKAKEEQSKINPKEMFLSQTDQYSQFDPETGTVHYHGTACVYRHFA